MRGERQGRHPCKNHQHHHRRHQRQLHHPQQQPHYQSAGTHLPGAAGVVQRVDMGAGGFQSLCRHVPAQIQCGEGQHHPHRNGAAGHNKRRPAAV